MNHVEIDEQELTREALAAADGAPETSIGPGQNADGAPASAVESWGPFIGGLIPTVSIVILPQWNLTEPERSEVQVSLTQCLDQAFPGGMSGPYACWCRLILACGGIAASRYIQHGALPPLGPKSEQEKPGASGPA